MAPPEDARRDGARGKDGPRQEGAAREEDRSRRKSIAREKVVCALRSAGLADAPAAPRADAFTIRPLDGGLGRRSYTASAGDAVWVVRVPAEDRAGALDVETEAAITREAAALGIAPRVITTDPKTASLITAHLGNSRPMTSEALKTPENIARCAQLLKRLHTIRHDYRRFDPEAFADEYLTAAAAATALTDADRRRAAELRELARVYRTRFPSTVLCHNDLVASNVLDDGRLKLVDFEYAVKAAPVLDLAGLAAMNDFDDDERWRLAEAYYAEAPVPFTARELRNAARLVRLIAYFWALSSAPAVDDHEAYAAFVERTAAALDTYRS